MALSGKSSAVREYHMHTHNNQQVGIGIGGEYPAGSVGCAESTGELKKGSRNLWFIMFTNTMIDWVSALISSQMRKVY